MTCVFRVIKLLEVRQSSHGQGGDEDGRSSSGEGGNSPLTSCKHWIFCKMTQPLLYDVVILIGYP